MCVCVCGDYLIRAFIGLTLSRKRKRKEPSTWGIEGTEQLPEEMCLIHRWQSGVWRDVLVGKYREGESEMRRATNATGAAQHQPLAFRLPPSGSSLVGLVNGHFLFSFRLLYTISYSSFNDCVFFHHIRRSLDQTPMNRFMTLPIFFPWNCSLALYLS